MDKYKVIVDHVGYSRGYTNGRKHREDGPSVRRFGYKAWFFNGDRHRESGPAIIYSDGSCHYYLQGEEVCESEHKRFLKMRKP